MGGGAAMGSWGELYHIPPPPPKRHCHALITTTSKLPPQESKGVEPEASASAVEGVWMAPEAPSSAVSQALEVVIPTQMTPLHLNVGASKGCINARLMGAVRGHQPYMLQSAHMCTETIYGWGWHVLPVTKPSSSWLPLGITKRFMVLSHSKKIFFMSIKFSSFDTVGVFVVLFLG